MFKVRPDSVVERRHRALYLVVWEKANKPRLWSCVIAFAYFGQVSLCYWIIQLSFATLGDS